MTRAATGTAAAGNAFANSTACVSAAGIIFQQRLRLLCLSVNEYAGVLFFRRARHTHDAINIREDNVQSRIDEVAFRDTTFSRVVLQA